jgi:hypothetical protein
LTLSVNGRTILKVDAGMNVQIVDKVKELKERIYGINDREIIYWKINSLRV